MRHGSLTGRPRASPSAANQKAVVSTGKVAIVADDVALRVDCGWTRGRRVGEVNRAGCRMTLTADLLALFESGAGETEYDAFAQIMKESVRSDASAWPRDGRCQRCRTFRSLI